jgi:CRISPR-associated protein Csb1
MPELNLAPLDSVSRLLLTVPLKPVQGDRFQPTGFPSLGAADYKRPSGARTVLVESSQSMANRLEATCWDTANEGPVAALNGISHVTVRQNGETVTDSMLEAHRLNSVYIERCKEKFFEETLTGEMAVDKSKPVNRRKFIDALFKYDIGCLIHGVFLESLDGRLRVARALSAFIEAVNVDIAASGGVKNDRVKATKDEGRTSKEGYGNVPFGRDEYVAEQIYLYFNLDLAQIRGYGLAQEDQRLVILLSLYRMRRLLESDLRLRTACDLEIDRETPILSRPADFNLPETPEIEAAVEAAISKCKARMKHTTVSYTDG